VTDEAAATRASGDFDAFVAAAQDRVRRALIPLAGADAARQATVDGLVYVWQHWDRVAAMDNPAGYLYTVSRSRLRFDRPLGECLPDDLAGPDGERHVEPALVGLLAGLTKRQRVAVYLVHGCRWPVPEVADLLGISVSSVRNHADRGLRKLRRQMEATS
jgi:DNA-directed RNA polymerase specialized sigma24 family protein